MYKDYRNDFSTTSASRLVDKTTYGIQKDKQQLEKNYDLKFDSKLRPKKNHVCSARGVGG